MASASTPALTEPGALMGLFRRLCAELDRPYDDAEIRAAGPIDGDRLDLRRLALIASRLGLPLRSAPLNRRSLRRATPPFLLLRRDGRALMVRSRLSDGYEVVEREDGQAIHATPRELLRRFDRLLAFRVTAREPITDLWTEAIRPRVRPVVVPFLLASGALNLLALATPLFLMAVYNKVIAHGSVDTLNALTVGMVVLFGFEWLLRVLRGGIASHTGARLDVALSAEIVHHLVRRPLGEAQALSTGEAIERLRQLDSIRRYFTGPVPLLLADLAFVGLFLGLLALIAPPLATLTLLAIPFFLGLSWLGQRRQRRLSEGGFAAASAKSATLNEALVNAQTVKALGLEPEVERRYERDLAEAAYHGYRAGVVRNAVQASGQGLQSGVGLALIYVGATGIIDGSLSIGALIAGTILAVRVLAPMRQAVGAWSETQQVARAIRRLNAVLRAAEARPGAMPFPLKRLDGRVRLERVTVRYRQGWPAALENVSLDVAPGAFVAVVGPPGSGKSTLVKLLAGLVEPSEGRVLLDDHDARQLPEAWRRERIGVVPQEVQLFRGTVADNIAIGSPDRSLERVVAAARFVGVHDAIQALPDGYRTELYEGGVGLSAGQRQLIALARALMRNPNVMILDEATSALDRGTEYRVLHQLKRASRGRTVFLVTHRLPADNLADRVLRLGNGRLLEPGDRPVLEAVPDEEGGLPATA